MSIELWWIGKTNFPYLKEGIEIYTKRIKKYGKFGIIEIPDVKFANKLSKEELKLKESQEVLKKLVQKDFLILLDENGKEFNSISFSNEIEKLQMTRSGKIVFLIGGAYGFSKELYERADRKISLSQMTFSHQMIRLFFVEQLYRAFSIINKEPYHHS